MTKKHQESIESGYTEARKQDIVRYLKEGKMVGESFPKHLHHTGTDLPYGIVALIEVLEQMSGTDVYLSSRKDVINWTITSIADYKE